MFFKAKKTDPAIEHAEALYAQAVAAARQPVFYTDLQVPDTVDGRFDMILLHLFPIFYAGKQSGKDVWQNTAQDVYDCLFADMDQSLREQGVGDLGVPKHMKRMMQAFYGRMGRYELALHDDMPEALKDNLFRKVDDVTPETLEKMAAYVRRLTESCLDKAEDIFERAVYPVQEV